MNGVTVEMAWQTLVLLVTLGFVLGLVFGVNVNRPVK